MGMLYTTLKKCWWAGCSCTLGLAFVCLAGCDSATGTQSWSIAGERESSTGLKAPADRPPSKKTLYAMARILTAQGRNSDCENLLKMLLDRHPEFSPAYCDLAALYLREGRVDEAIETLTRGVRVAPEDPTLLNNLGMCWMLRKQYAEALEMFTSAAIFSSKDARYRTNMAVVLSMMGRNVEAKSLFEQVLPDEEAHHNMNVLASARGLSKRNHATGVSLKPTDVERTVTSDLRAQAPKSLTKAPAPPTEAIQSVHSRSGEASSWPHGATSPSEKGTEGSQPENSWRSYLNSRPTATGERMREEGAVRP